jgi:hypothetical protein
MENLVASALLEPRVQKAIRAIRVNKDFKEKLGRKVQKVKMELRARLALKAIQAQWDLRDLKENEAPKVLRASQVFPVKQENQGRRVTRDLWVLWDLKESKAKSVLLDRWVLWERRVQRVKWELTVALLTKWQWLMASLAQSGRGLTLSGVRTESLAHKEPMEELV